MTKQEIYRDLCIEAGTYEGGEMTADEWYAACGHNITADLDQTLATAATGDAHAIAEARQACGLPVLA
jgi:hypothetical protein